MARVRHHRPSQTRRLPRVVCVVGPTSSGKTALGIRLAHKFNGEIINADARQCYKEFNIGTGKPPGTRGTIQGRRAFLVDGVAHHLMDLLAPIDVMTVAEWRELALTAMKGILRRDHLPLIVGGTGLYIKSIVDNLTFPRIPPQPGLRQAFEKTPLPELVKLLLRLDPTAEEAIDLQNPRRVMRALEVVTLSGKPFKQQSHVGKPIVEAFQVGLHWKREELYARIDHEIEHMIERGWIDEIREIMRKKLPLDAPAMTSIGYRELLAYLQGEKTLDEAIGLCKQMVHRYAKRQETWFKKDSRIHWAKDSDEAMEMVAEWLEKTL